MSKLQQYLEMTKAGSGASLKDEGKFIRLFKEFENEMYLIIGDDKEAAEFEKRFKKDPKEAVQYFVKEYGNAGHPASFEDTLDILREQDIDVSAFE